MWTSRWDIRTSSRSQRPLIPARAFSIRASKTSNSQSPSSFKRRRLTIRPSRNWSPFTRTRTPSKPPSPKDLATIQSSTRCPGSMTLISPHELSSASPVRGFRRPLPEAQSALPAADASLSIAFDHVGKVYRPSSGPVHALHGIDLSIPRGSIFGIIGRSGAGKSSLLRTINGLEAPSAGRVVVDGLDVAALDKAGLIALRRRVGMIFQHFNLLSAKTVWHNVALPLVV